MFAVMMETDYYKKQIFRKNFWTDFTAILKKTRKDKLMTDLEKCDFTPIFEWHKAKKEKEKADKAEAGAEVRFFLPEFRPFLTCLPLPSICPVLPWKCLLLSMCVWLLYFRPAVSSC